MVRSKKKYKAENQKVQKEKEERIGINFTSNNWIQDSQHQN